MAGIRLLTVLTAAALAAPAQVAEYKAPPVIQLAARTLRVFDAAEADQGVAADKTHFYAVGNTIVAKYAIASGTRAGHWEGPRNGMIRHLNSCLADAGRIWCANSNYSQTPMGSSIEIFDTATMRHADSRSLGMLDEGSLTWFDRYHGGWIAGFAHYDANGGVPFKDHRFSSVVTFDAEWRRTGGWLFPASVLERMAPYAASGGAIGPDGWLYLLGHDRPEMYVVARPSMGPTLIHVATIALDAEGQAFSWAQDGSRTVFTIDRRKKLVRTIAIPAVTAADPAVSLRFR
ncbi:MAG TPA: hypothetical protein VKH34_11830 [Vicinamibacterales bacterium]|nr:hypothetical protein [Vicinamibacterales bacterium]